MNIDTDALERAAKQGDPNAQFTLGAYHAQQQNSVAAIPWLRSAAKQGHLGAQNVLASIYQHGAGVPRSVEEAFRWYASSAQAGSPIAQFHLANMSFSGVGTARDHDVAKSRLLGSARGGYPRALRTLGMIYARVGREETGTGCFVAAAEAGDALAAHLLGCESQDDSWLTVAARGGVGRSAVLLSRRGITAPAPQPQGARPVDASRVADLVEDFEWPDTEEHHPETHSESPRVYTVKSILSLLECEYLIATAEPALKRATTVHPESGESLQHEFRTSWSMNFDLVTEDLVVQMIKTRLASVGGLPVTHSEPLAVMRYHPTQEYKPHYDFLDLNAAYRDQALASGGQRVVSILTYLSDVDRGGGTQFPELGLTIEPVRGKALAFKNCNEAGEPDERTLHAGLPVEQGEKWLASLWLRENPFVPL